MKKIISLFSLVLIFSFVSHAQKGNNQISLGPEVDVPIGALGDAYKVGFGGSIKGLFGVGTAGQVTLTTGFSSFSGKSGTTNGYSYKGQTYHIIPVLVGYRQHFASLYVEPALGVASYTTKATGVSFTETRFTYAVGVGYAQKALDLGLRLQSHTGSSLLAIRLAYAFGLHK